MRSGFFSMLRSVTARFSTRSSSSTSATPSVSASARKLALQHLLLNPQLVGRQRVVQWNRGAIVDRLADRVLVEVSARIVTAEDLEGALAVGGLVDRCVPVNPRLGGVG